MSDTPHLVPVPGGMARLRAPSEVTVRHARELQNITAAFGITRFTALIQSAAVQEAAGDDTDDPATRERRQEVAYFAAIEEMELTPREVDLLDLMTPATIYKWLAELKVPGLRTPKTRDEVLDLPPDVYGALAQVTGRLQAEEMERQAKAEGFTPEAVGDDTSPGMASSA